ncbi:hypothetical protein [Pseudomonas chlororaphis]|nr:hypothetical protein [Pseudomonas chlororaphis]
MEPRPIRPLTAVLIQLGAFGLAGLPILGLTLLLAWVGHRLL